MNTATASKQRIYAVTANSETRLVEAANVAQAIRHVAGSTIAAELATQSRLIELTKAGVEVEHALHKRIVAKAGEL